MKSIVLAIALFFSSQTLSAMSIGREGSPYLQEGTEWQPVKYDDRDIGFTAAFPGDPRSGISGADAFIHSELHNVHYEIHTNMSQRYIPPATESAFIAQVEDAFGAHATITPLPTTQKTIKYLTELHFHDRPQVVRILCSTNQLYWAIVQGADLSLSLPFFNSIAVTK